MFFVIKNNGYICGVGKGNAGTPISEAEYTELVDVIATKPEASATVDYRLTESLEWEAYTPEPPKPYVEPDDPDEVVDILLGVSE